LKRRRIRLSIQRSKFVKTGTHEIEEIDENGLTRRLRFVITAKCTKLGIETLRYMKL